MEEEVKSKILMFGQRAVENWNNEKVTSLTPERTDNYLSFFAGYSAILEEELGKLEMAEPIVKTEYLEKAQAKTESAAERLWLVSEKGQRQIKVKHTIKAVDKIISACKKRLDRFKQELYNQS